MRETEFRSTSKVQVDYTKIPLDQNAKYIIAITNPDDKFFYLHEPSGIFVSEGGTLYDSEERASIVLEMLKDHRLMGTPFIFPVHVLQLLYDGMALGRRLSELGENVAEVAV